MDLIDCKTSMWFLLAALPLNRRCSSRPRISQSEAVVQVRATVLVCVHVCVIDGCFCSASPLKPAGSFKRDEGGFWSSLDRILADRKQKGWSQSSCSYDTEMLGKRFAAGGRGVERQQQEGVTSQINHKTSILLKL